jgi:hypothetical protein
LSTFSLIDYFEHLHLPPHWFRDWKYGASSPLAISLDVVLTI